MANRHKAEAEIVIGGKNYKLAVTMHAWALAQDALTKRDQVPSIEDIVKRLEVGHLLTVVAVFWGSLQRHHPEIQTLEQATELMELAEGKAAKVLAEAMKRANPDPTDVRELGINPNPPTAQGDAPRGTGETSISEPVASA